jgi:sugar phosphate isomerase/epimerase
LKDYAPSIATDVPQRKLVPPGLGSIDFGAVLKAMRETGVQHGFIEVDVSDDALGDVRRGHANLERLKGCA